MDEQRRGSMESSRKEFTANPKRTKGPNILPHSLAGMRTSRLRKNREPYSLALQSSARINQLRLVHARTRNTAGEMRGRISNAAVLIVVSLLVVSPISSVMIVLLSLAAIVNCEYR